MVNNKDNGVFMSRNSIGLIDAPWKFDVLKTSIFVLRTSNFRGQLSADSSSTETLYCLIKPTTVSCTDAIREFRGHNLANHDGNVSSCGTQTINVF